MTRFGSPLWHLHALWCRWFSHRWAIERRGSPVTCFSYCARCGKLGVRVVE